MPSYVDSAKFDFSLSPQERRERQEVMDAMKTVNQALKLLAKSQNEITSDLKSRQIVISSRESLAKIQTFVDKTFASTLSPPSL